MAVALAMATAVQAAPQCEPGPRWAKGVQANAMAGLIPERAVAAGKSGQAILRCTARADGRLTDCSIQAETPPGYGFGDSALKAVDRLRLHPICAGSDALQAGKIHVPFDFSLPKRVLSTAPHRDAVYQPTTGRFQGLEPAGPYWPELALHLGYGGFAVIECKVAVDSRLEGCRLRGDQPEELSFGKAALRMAAKGWMTAGPPPADVVPPADGVWSFTVIFPTRARVEAG